MVRPTRHVRKAPNPDLCVDGDLGLTTRSEAALEPPRFISRMLTGRRTSVRDHGTGLAPDGVARLVVIPGCSRPR
jgi:hypothetical protein